MPSNTEIANFFTPITNQIDGASYVCLNINGSNLSTPNVIQPYVTVNNRGGQPAMFVKIFGLQEFVTANAPSGGSYVLPIASSTVLGGIKVGTGLSIAGDGTLSATGGGGGVSSVGLSAPTGFSVSNSPITTSGTIALSFASGYSLPSNSVQATWTAKQDALSGTGVVKSTAGVISYISGTSAQYIAGDGTLVTFPTLTGYVPYTGATTNVNIGVHSFIANDGVYNTQMSPSFFGVENNAATIFGLLEFDKLTLTNSVIGSSLAVSATEITFPNASVQTTAFPPTGGTTAQYIRGDGSLAIFPTIPIVTPSNVTVGSTKITLGGTPTGAALQAFSIDVNEANLTLNNIGGTLGISKGGTNLTALGTSLQLLRVNAGATALEYFTPAYLTSAITSLNGLTVASQTFVNDTNVTIVSSGSTHTITWTGTLADSRIASASDWNTAYTNRITSLTTTGSGAATLISNVLNIPTPASATFVSLTTTGSSGSATLSGGVLNVPTYTLAGLGGQPLATNLTSLSGLTYASDSFVKMTAAGIFALDTNTYITGNQTITLSGEASGSGTTAISVTLTNSAVIGKVLTGYTSGAGIVVATDTILQAIQKLNGNIDTVNIIIITSVSITTNTLDANSVGQNGRNVMINNGATAINVTCEASSATNFCASYTKLGSTAITFVAGSGATLTTVDGTAILNGAVGSTACLTRTANAYYLQISNR